MKSPHPTLMQFRFESTKNAFLQTQEGVLI